MLKKNNITMVFIALLMFLQYNTIAQSTEPYVIGEYHKISSKLLNEERTYIVELPKSYNATNKNYPLLVLLDGEVNYHSHSGIINHMTQGRQIPEMIIVAINNVDRVRDYTPTKYLTNLNGSSAIENHKTSGGSTQFLRFVEEELLPSIEKNYRTNSFKILIGISHGGLLVGSAFLSKQTSFNAFISMDPSFWWDHQYIIKQLDKTNLKQIEYKRFYLSTADKFENFKRIPHVFTANINSHELFNTQLKNKGFSPSKVKLDYFREENHWTVALMSLCNGLQFVYKDLIMRDIEKSSLDEIVTYYKTNYNGAFSPPEREINSIGYNYLKSDLNKALAFFKINVTNYPTSSNAFDSLGEVYMCMEDKQNALKNYEQSLELNPKNDNARKMIAKLKKS